METWAMYTAGEGSELTRGMQAPAHKARETAQRTANRIGRAVELIEEGARKGELFEPDAKVA
jgi:hypothetical protein